ncbi:hypothetical protein JCM6882_006007 [Rhodosporidiobolus microsporus]
MRLRGRRRAYWAVWAQSSALLSPSDNPTLLVVSGKTTVAGQTVDSTPSTSSALSLDLSSPITDLSSPQWADLSSTGPVAAYGSLVPLSASAALFYGGDATGDSSVAVQTGSDSSWLLSLSSTSSSPINNLTSSWTPSSSLTPLWPSQPPRRSLAFTASATNGTLSRAWIFGGQRPDGSGTVYNELWEVQLAVDPLSGAPDRSTAQWAQWTGGNSDAPPAMWDGTAVLLPSTESGALPSIYLVGGVESPSSGSSALSSLSTIHVFTPSAALGSGTWSTLSASSGDVPAARRGHVAVDIGDGKIWVQGGRGGEGEGAEVFSDAAVLNTKEGRWEKVEDGEQAWGRTGVMVGETVVVAFGYGLNSAASTALSVYSPSNDTWLDAYYPSYLAASSSSSAGGGIVSNPKNGADSSAGSAADSGAATEAGTAAGATPTSPSSSGDSSSSSSGHDQDGEDSPSTPQWTAPGAAGTSPPSSSNPSGDNSDKDGDDSGTASKGTIAGAVVGSLFGALALVAGGAFAVKRYRDQQRYNGAGGRFTGDDDELGGGAYGGGAGGLMSEHRAAGGYASSEMYNLGKTLPSTPATVGAGAGGGVMGALVGFLSPRQGSSRYASSTGAARAGGGGGKRRFDMLRDEDADSDVWDASVRTRDGQQGWEQFGDFDEKAAAEEEGRMPSLSGRGGVGIWDGFGAGGGGGGGGGVGDSIKSSTSYLGGALGGFIGLAGGAAAVAARSTSQRERDEEEAAGQQSQVHEYASVAHPSQQPYADPTLTPIVEWEEDEDEEDDDGTGTEPGGVADETRTYESHNTHSSGTHQTVSTGMTSAEGYSPAKRSVGVAAGAAALGASTSRPFSPAHSLYGSSFNPQPATFYATGNPLSRTSSATSSLAPGAVGGGGGGGRGNSSWWSRLNRPSKSSSGEVPTPTAFEAIRDPAPAPSLSMAAIAESDPFADAPSLSSHGHRAAPVSRGSSTRITRPDEHGRFGEGVRLTHGEHDRSVSSNTSEVTATSSVLEERLRGMDVVERVRTGSGGDSSCEVTPTMGANEEGTFGRLPTSSDADDPFADAPLPPVPSKPATYTPAAGSVVWAGSSAGGAFSDVGSFRASTPPPVPPLPSVIPPTPSYAPPPPSSPRKRLHGPRPQPPPSPSSASAFSPPSALLARSSSVKDLVAQIERKASGTFDAGAALQLPAPPQATKRKGRKVEHGLARKPVLYVANPDEE